MEPLVQLCLFLPGAIMVLWSFLRLTRLGKY